MLKKAVICLMLLIVSGGHSAWGESVWQELDGRLSSVRVEGSMGPLEVQGKIPRVRGRLRIDPLNPGSANVELTVDANSLELGGEAAPLLQEMLKRLLGGEVLFTSSGFLKLSSRRYIVRGTVRSTLQNRAVSFPVDLVSCTLTETRVHSELTAAQAELPEGGGGELRGVATFDLVFRR
jgi:polyisoprenoid-binding protein YceI